MSLPNSMRPLGIPTLGVLFLPGHGPRGIDQSAEGDNYDQQGLSDGPSENNIIRWKHRSSPLTQMLSSAWIGRN